MQSPKTTIAPSPAPLREPIRHVLAWLTPKVFWRFGWHGTLRSWGNSKLVCRASMFLLIAPVCARLLHLTIELDRIAWLRDLAQTGLPDTVAMMFWVAIMFFAAKILYAIFCPDHIRRFGDFCGYRMKSDSGFDLARRVRELAAHAFDGDRLARMKLLEIIGICLRSDRDAIRASGRRLRNALLGAGYESNARVRLTARAAEDLMDATWETNPPFCEKVYQHVRHFYSYSRPSVRMAVGGLFVVGFLLFFSNLLELMTVVYGLRDWS